MGTAQQDWTVGKMSELDEPMTQDDRDAIARDVYDAIAPPESDEPEQTPQEAADADGSDALIKKAEKAQTNYAKRIRDIFGDAAPKYDCPNCNGLGLVWNVDEPEVELVHPDNLVTCEACNGYGNVITGSKAPGRETTVCIACSGNGYRTVTVQPENVTPITPTGPYFDATTSAPVMGWMGPDGKFQPLGTPQAGNG